MALTFDSRFLLLLAAVAAPFYLAALYVYRVYLCKLANIPGPKLAAFTYYYQSYYDLYPYQGRFLFQCEALHKKYGPIVRIGPDEIHINDPDYYNEIYASNTRRRDKSALWFWMGGSNNFGDNSAFTTLNHDLHRLRRSAVNPHFSKQKVQELEPRVRNHVLHLKKRLLDLAGTDELVDLSQATSALTLDVISDYAFGKAVGALERPDMAKPWNDMLHAGVKIHPFARTFPTVARNMLRIPAWMMPTNNMKQEVDKFMGILTGMTQSAKDEAPAEKAKIQPGDLSSGHTNVLQAIFNSTLPEEEKTFSRVAGEAMIFVGAGTETTGRTLAVTLYNILASSEVHDRLLEEIRTVIPESRSPLPPATQLEQLPYLTAVIQEGLRISHGVAGRLARIAPDEDLNYHGHQMPRGTTFSQSNYLVHTHPKYFPDPFKFQPERFMGLEGEQARRHLVAFGRGNRACVGLNLAYSELFLTIATLIGTLKMELVDTTARDATIVTEYFIGCLPADSKGIRVRVLGEL
ncbi:hypothetical protein LTR56_004477 [Elasticomyces elasticus]|nr:hypothetical protein LTR56_004477 [Elasticomyces elasticus]KAK3654210.1 hypothetical protein LTR22_010836 [Elasticomyces elasticus]KAK4920016.1 hypothetical protein LTR49_012454 [Elasticomyces elasticus]KAK5758850.1 hypothetical protein LTS12_011091 [Elasticomyces elasticus]